MYFYILREIVSVKPPTPPHQLLSEIEYDIVERGSCRARVVTIIESIVDSIKFIRNGREIIVLVKTDQGYCYCRIGLWFKPKDIGYKLNNGVLTIDFN